MIRGTVRRRREAGQSPGATRVERRALHLWRPHTKPQAALYRHIDEAFLIRFLSDYLVEGRNYGHVQMV